MVGDHPQPNQPSNVDIANHMVTKIIHHDQVLWQLNSQTACPMKKYVEFLGKKPAGSRLNRPRKNTKVDFWLVVFRHPSEKYESVGLTIPNIWGKKHVPNHQPDLVSIFPTLGGWNPDWAKWNHLEPVVADFAIHSLCIWANWNNEIAESRDCKIDFSAYRIILLYV